MEDNLRFSVDDVRWPEICKGVSGLQVKFLFQNWWWKMILRSLEKVSTSLGEPEAVFKWSYLVSRYVLSTWMSPPCDFTLSLFYHLPLNWLVPYVMIPAQIGYIFFYNFYIVVWEKRFHHHLMLFTTAAFLASVLANTLYPGMKSILSCHHHTLLPLLSRVVQLCGLWGDAVVSVMRL
jgi:hypothetical protein